MPEEREEGEQVDFSKADAKAEEYLKGKLEAKENNAPTEEQETTTNVADETTDTSTTEAPKTDIVKHDGVEEEVPVDELIEKGKKLHGLEASLTRKGQDLAKEREDLEAYKDELDRRSDNVALQMQTALENDRQLAQLREEEKAEKVRLKDMRELDPLAYEREVKDKGFTDRINSLQTQLDEQKSWRQLQEENAKIKGQQDLLKEAKDASEKTGIGVSAIIGETYMTEEKLSIMEIAKRLEKEEEKKIQKRIAEAQKQANQDDGDTKKSPTTKKGPSLARISTAESGTADAAPQKQKQPDILKDEDAFDDQVITAFKERMDKRWK